MTRKKISVASSDRSVKVEREEIKNKCRLLHTMTMKVLDEDLADFTRDVSKQSLKEVKPYVCVIGGDEYHCIDA